MTIFGWIYENKGYIAAAAGGAAIAGAVVAVCMAGGPAAVAGGVVAYAGKVPICIKVKTLGVEVAVAVGAAAMKAAAKI